MDRRELEVPPYFGRPLEREQLIVATYYNFAELQATEHQLTRNFVEHGRMGKVLKSEIEADDWHTRAPSVSGLVTAHAAPRGEVSRITATAKDAAARTAEPAARGTSASSGGLSLATAGPGF